METKVKICGLTRKEEAAYLNEAGADYAGFVFYPQSKRNVSIEEAKEIMQALSPSIKKVAVLVSPDLEQVREIEEAGFDIIQIHKELKKEVYEAASRPIWRALNVSKVAELQKLGKEAGEKAVGEKEEKEQSQEKQKSFETADPNHKIAAYLIDGEKFGSGQTFDWSAAEAVRKLLGEKEFVLAGGLNPDNVEEGIRLFSPDIVDVSSGVEGDSGKDRKKILEFVRKAKKNG